jgi:hypothetical protein
MRRGLLAATLLVLAGCFGDEPRTIAQPPAATAFAPEQFNDIPLPRGYMFSPGRDQLAVSLAGGTVRRFEVVMEQRENAAPQPPADLLHEMGRDLRSHGWQAEQGPAGNQHWRKGQERLLLETGRSGGRTTIRIRLRPDQAISP